MVKHEICAMQILVIAATEHEIEPLRTQKPGVQVLITGVGVPSAIYRLQKHIPQLNDTIIIQAGIAGSFDTGLPLGQTVLIERDCFADLGIEEKGNYTPVFKTGLTNADEFPFTNGWLVNTEDNLKHANLPRLKAITVNKVSDSAVQKQQYIHEFNADVESMEGAALHYVCLQENIPFIQLRSVSNYVGERDKTKWKMKEAIENLNTALSILINKITGQP